MVQKEHKCGANNQEERTEVEGIKILLGRSNPENEIRIKIQESKAGLTLMTREHNKKKAVSELARHQTALTCNIKKEKILTETRERS